MRTDLSLASQIIQSNHATFEMAVKHARSLDREEPTDTPSVVLIGVPDKSALEAVMERLQRYGIKFEAFYEPDFDLGLTAVATYPITNKKQRYVLRQYRTWTESEQGVAYA